MVSRRDLRPGAQAVQAAHALADFSVAHPDAFREWHQHNYLVFLSVADEAELQGLHDRLSAAGCPVTSFREPDMGGALTAVCAGGHPAVRRETARIPLMLRHGYEHEHLNPRT